MEYMLVASFFESELFWVLIFFGHVVVKCLGNFSSRLLVSMYWHYLEYNNDGKDDVPWIGYWFMTLSSFLACRYFLKIHFFFHLPWFSRKQSGIKRLFVDYRAILIEYFTIFIFATVGGRSFGIPYLFFTLRLLYVYVFFQHPSPPKKCVVI